MAEKHAPPQGREFRRPEGILLAGIGCLFLVAAGVGAVMAIIVVPNLDLKAVVLIALGFSGAIALGAGFINAWRVPMLTIRSDALIVPTFFGAKSIPVKPGHPVGEFLASSHKGSTRGGTIEGNKFVHFFTQDADGTLVELVSLHRAAPVIAQMRRAFEDVAGLKVETLRADKTSRSSRPDVAHWRRQ